MFNTYVTKTADTQYVPYDKTITEIKAPTDESIKLLNEWKDKLMEQIVGVYRTENCAIDMVAVQSRSPNTMETLLSVKTTINGKDQYYAYTINEELMRTKTFVDILMDKVNQIVADNVKEILRETLIKDVVLRHIKGGQ